MDAVSAKLQDGGAASAETLPISRRRRRPASIDVNDIEARINARAAGIGVIGLGYVGLPLACLAAERGFAVVGFDIDEGKIDAVNKGKSYIRHISQEKVAPLVSRFALRATADFSEIAEADIVLICTPTPLTPMREPDLSCVITAAENVAAYLRPGHLIVFESTSYPGTSREILLPILERSGLKSAKEFFFAYSAEREDPGKETSRPRASRESSAATARMRSGSLRRSIRESFPRPCRSLLWRRQKSSSSRKMFSAPSTSRS
jgi:UDP-glucose/GDP-mannose dehydrogenase family protein